MADPNVYEVAHLKDADDILVTLGVDYDRVTISTGRWGSGGGIKLTRAQCEVFAQYFVHACWEAALDFESEPDREDGAPLDGYVSDPAGQSGPGRPYYPQHCCTHPGTGICMCDCHDHDCNCSTMGSVMRRGV